MKSWGTIFSDEPTACAVEPKAVIPGISHLVQNVSNRIGWAEQQPATSAYQDHQYFGGICVWTAIDVWYTVILCWLQKLHREEDFLTLAIDFPTRLQRHRASGPSENDQRPKSHLVWRTRWPRERSPRWRQGPQGTSNDFLVLPPWMGEWSSRDPPNPDVEQWDDPQDTSCSVKSTRGLCIFLGHRIEQEEIWDYETCRNWRPKSKRKAIFKAHHVGS